MTTRETVATGMGLLLLAGTAPAQDAPSFGVSRELVRVDVVALDHDGRAVRGLTADDFEIVQKGRRLPITSFEAVVVSTAPTPAAGVEGTDAQATAPAPAEPDRNRAFVILFDDVNLGPAGAFRVQADLAKFLASGALSDGDLVSLVTTDGVLFTARTAGERQRMADLVRDLRGVRRTDSEMTREGLVSGLSDSQAMEAARFGTRDPSSTRNLEPRTGGINPADAAVRYLGAQDRAAAGLSAIAHALLALEGFRGRKSLIVYSEGYIKSPDLPQYDQVVELARRTRVTIFFADASGDGGDGTPAEGRMPGQAEGRQHMHLQEGAAGAAYVAVATGGRAANTNDQTVLLREAAEQASAYYLLGFDPPDDRPGERKIQVRSRKGFRLRAPDRYFVAAAPPPADTAAALRGAMASMFDADGIPFTVATGWRDGVSSTSFTISLARAAGDPERRLDLRIEARPLGSGGPVRDASELTVPSGSAPARLTRDLSLRPGTWQAKVAVRDRDTGEIGSVLHTFEVKDRAATAP
jgi:VWFA-related protein